MKIEILDEMPQWIRSSEFAAYHPSLNIIYLRKDRWWKDFFHESGHWFFCKYNFDPSWHIWWDKGQDTYK